MSGGWCASATIDQVSGCFLPVQCNLGCCILRWTETDTNSMYLHWQASMISHALAQKKEAASTA